MPRVHADLGKNINTAMAGQTDRTKLSIRIPSLDTQSDRRAAPPTDIPPYVAKLTVQRRKPSRRSISIAFWAVPSWRSCST